MRLKTIKLAGFKSFVDPTTIPIQANLSAIVGPNGCGKSNVVDAVKWVIGETSAKQLRGQSMSDVIFNGTTTRKPVAKASVELLFSNEEGRLLGEYAHFSEISVRREVERDGQSNYYLNNTHCRRRDIIDIFLGTGLGPRSYAIIEQGMISQLIEAKPDELRAHLEEAAGISKYKERRRDTENRMRRTQENLDRLDDLREELDKQLRHLKRQANAAERYKILKADERQLQAQVKALQWQGLKVQLSAHDEKITAQDLQLESLQTELRTLETDLEKSRQDQVAATETQNEAQRAFYSVGSEVSRLEQQIRYQQEQRDQWSQELIQGEASWRELTQGNENHRTQIAELESAIAALSPQSGDIEAAAQQAQQIFTEAQADMQTWQQQWDDCQQRYAQAARQAEVVRTKLGHQQQQIQQWQQRQQDLTQTQAELQIDQLSDEIAPLSDRVVKAEQARAEVERQLVATKAQITAQRDSNQQLKQQAAKQRQTVQSLDAKAAALSALQASALGYDNENTKTWLADRQLTNQARLGQQLQVDSGWELAVETILGAQFDAVCVDNINDFINAMPELAQGELMLMDKAQASTAESPAAGSFESLLSHVKSEWPIHKWLAGVYVAETIELANTMRLQLAANESVVTRDGVWMGRHWARVAKAADNDEGILVRKQRIETLQTELAKEQSLLSQQEQALQQGEQQLIQLEQQRDQHHENYQQSSRALTDAQTALTAKRSKLEELTQQQQRLSLEIDRCTNELAALQSGLTDLNAQQAQSDSEEQALQDRKNQLSSERDHYHQALETARAQAQQEQQKMDEWQIRLNANQSQLDLLQRTLERDERQLTQLTEHREKLTQQLADTEEPIKVLQTTLQEQLEQRVGVEQALKAAEVHLGECNARIQQVEKDLHNVNEARSQAQERLQELKIERQTIEVRQTTITEQLEEMEQALSDVIESLPEEAEIKVWQQQLDTVTQKIQRLGAINLAAIDEYKETEERKVYLDSQHEDLTEALSVLEGAIRKIDRETRAKFRETYDKVNEGFKRLFPKIFGGGQASLEMLDDDVLTAGIMVKAQPPGKRNSTIHMLSGGEKALTAISLVFSMFQLNPAPFCMLDEVDAPLDDVNVGRFCQLVKEMAKDVQFLVISHNKVTIEMADRLMGVTMQEPGASRLVAVDMQAAIEMATAA